MTGREVIFWLGLAWLAFSALGASQAQRRSDCNLNCTCLERSDWPLMDRKFECECSDPRAVDAPRSATQGKEGGE